MHWLVGMERVNSCLIGWPDSLLRNGGIDLRAVRLVAVLRVGAGVHRRPVVRVNHVAGRAAAVAIIARMIVGAGQRQNRIEQTRFLQTQEIPDRFAARCPVRDRSACRPDGRDLRPDWECRSQTALRRRVRTRAECCRAAKLPSGPADPDAAARPSSRQILRRRRIGVQRAAAMPSGE